MEGPLIGLGTGAMGFIGGVEYVNTCFPEEYINAVNREELPIAGAREVSRVERAVRYSVCSIIYL